jgi:hypothetical protein
VDGQQSIATQQLSKHVKTHATVKVRVVLGNKQRTNEFAA